MAAEHPGAAIYRSMGKTNITMYLSLVSNGINILGNAIGVFLLHAGVAGVAYPSLIARSFSAAVILILCFKKSNEVYLVWKKILCWKGVMIQKILGIAVPNGIENGLFQLIKVALSSITALFGTVQIAANGVAQSFWSVAALMGTALGLAFITVIGQCMGAGKYHALKVPSRTDYRQKLQTDAEKQHQQQTYPEIRHGYAKKREAPQTVIHKAVLMGGLYHTERYGYQKHQDHGKNGQLQRRPEPIQK